MFDTGDYVLLLGVHGPEDEDSTIAICQACENALNLLVC